MGAINGFMLLNEIFGSVGTTKYLPTFTMKEIRRANNLTFLKHLPEFNESVKYFTFNDKKYPIGTIVKRPLKIGIGFHYSVWLGMSKSNEFIFLEIVPDKNIRTVNLAGFMAGLGFNIDRHPPEGLTRETIIRRASEYQYDDYDLWDLNCIDFARHCVLGIKPVKRSLKLKEMQIELNNMSIAAIQIILSNQNNEQYVSLLRKKMRAIEMNSIILNKQIAQA